MKLGLVSAILTEYTFEQVIDFAAEAGYKCVEIMTWPKGKADRRYAGVTHIDIDHLDELNIKYIKDYAASKSVELSALGYYPNPLDPDQEKREIYIQHIKKMIVASSKLGINQINTFIGKDKNKTVEENFELFEKIWVPIIQFADQYNVKVGIENCPMYFTVDEWPGGCNLASSPYIWKKMFELIPSKNFGLNYDPSHLYLQRMDYIKPIYDFKDRIFHVHIKDIVIYEDKINTYGAFTYPLNYCAPKIPGLGGIEWKKFVSALYDIKYTGAACVEIEDKTFEESTELIVGACKMSFRYLSQFFDL
ncbi:MAG: sugar phosphate isomerase/epimerase [Clostridia bacterium]|jgi:sugar phosphate isomerase/epimerase|nr:sugar phosphate isomerase/epimerase [Clostridia bacterium]